MGKFVSVEAAAEKLRNYKLGRDIMTSHNDMIDFAISLLCAEVPAADVRPVVRGKWEPAGGTVFPIYACSLCRAISFGGNFCSNCGADMREPQMLKNASQNADDDVMMPAT